MHKSHKTILPLLLVATATLISLLPAADEAEAINAPILKGTWRLVSRTLADSSIVDDSLVSGIMVFTETTKHQTMSWKNGDGKWTTITHLADYIFDREAYVERNIYHIQTISSRIDSVAVNASDTAAKSDVEVRDYGYWFSFPLFDSPDVYYTGPFIKTYEPGVYEDRWERLK